MAIYESSQEKFIYLLVSDAVDVILLHSSSIHSILNRRAITKDILFKYLHDNKVPVQNNFTKQFLIDRALLFWKQTYGLSIYDGNHSVQITEIPSDQDEISEIVMSEPDYSQTSQVPQLSLENQVIDSDQQHFPINQMARKFAHWFYTKLNEGTLQDIDFWRDVHCLFEFLERGRSMLRNELSTNESVLAFCQSLRTQYELHFNLNETHSGTQGRMESHGLVLVLSCGTLHKTDQMVGVFECVFGLARDPFSDNNWKINRMKWRLHNNPMQQQQPQQAIALNECETLVPLLSIDVSDEGIG